jgi:hypothetical protein
MESYGGLKLGIRRFAAYIRKALAMFKIKNMVKKVSILLTYMENDLSKISSTEILWKEFLTLIFILSTAEKFMKTKIGGIYFRDFNGK